MSAADVVQEQPADPFTIERPLRVVADTRIGEQIGEVMPEAELRVVAVGVLEALDREESFDALCQRLEPIDALLKQGKIRVGTAGGSTGECGGDCQCYKRAAHARILYRDSRCLALNSTGSRNWLASCSSCDRSVLTTGMRCLPWPPIR